MPTSGETKEGFFLKGKVSDFCLAKKIKKNFF